MPDSFVPALLAGERPAPVRAEERPRLEALLEEHRLIPLAVALTGPGGGDSVFPGGVPDGWVGVHRATTLRNALLLEMVEEVQERLRAVEVPALDFKGAALVRQGVYPDPGDRPMDDADLLVPPEGAARAVNALIRSGFTPWMRWNPEHLRWLDTMTFTAPGSTPALPLVLDLHWGTEYGVPRFGRGGGARSPLWDGWDTHGPAPEPHLVVIAEHILKHIAYRPHLLGIADLARLVLRVRRWNRVVELAEGRELGGAVGLLLEVIADELASPVPASVPRAMGSRNPWLRAARGRLRVGRLVVRGGAPESRSVGLLLRGALLGGGLKAGRVAWETLVPEPEWLRARYSSPEDPVSPLPLRVRYLAEVGRWLVGRGPSPVSPNQPG